MLWQAADVVVALDDVGLAGAAAGRLDHVRVDGALRQPAGVGQPVGLLLEDLDEQVADDLALGLRVGHPGERGEVAVGGVHLDHPHAQVLGEGGHDLLGLLEAQQAGVHEHAGELVADGLVQQRGDHGRIHAAGEPEDHLVRAHLLAHAGDLVLDDVGGCPQRLAATDVDHEAAEDRLALAGMGHFRVELHAIPALLVVGEGGYRYPFGAGGDGEARRFLRHVVAVAHPHFQPRGRARQVGQAGQQLVLRGALDFCVSVFALVRRLSGAAELAGHGLHAVADAQHRQAAVEYFLRRLGAAFQGGRLRAAGQDDPPGRELRDLGRVVVPGPDFAVDPDLADPAGDELGVLRPEIEDQDLVVMDVGHYPAR